MHTRIRLGVWCMVIMLDGTVTPVYNTPKCGGTGKKVFTQRKGSGRGAPENGSSRGAHIEAMEHI